MEHKILSIPSDMDSFKQQLITFGFQGWELVFFRNGLAYLNKYTVPVTYEIIKNPEYMNDYKNSLDSLGTGDWIFIDTKNGYSFFKKISIV